MCWAAATFGLLWKFPSFLSLDLEASAPFWYHFPFSILNAGIKASSRWKQNEIVSNKNWSLQ